ncbi:MAG: tetratricopeptide repeat-containing diguanylate cyclase [Wenzhouxiangellaceae bacterium]|nr:tetratricopeptide repeat-containing diguanylate cyclase [Wenzhouxiangellaceae bacterium]
MVRKNVSVQPVLIVIALLLCAPWQARADEMLEQASELRRHDPAAALELLDREIGAPDDKLAGGMPESARTRLAGMLELRAGILRDRGRLDAAMADAERLQRLAEGSTDPVLTAGALFLQGSITAERGAIADALEKFHAARRLLEPTDALAEKARINNALAVAHTFAENYPRARQYYERALELARRAGDAAMEASVLGNLPLVIAELEGPDAALQAHRRALAVAERHGAEPLVAQQLANICSVLVQIGRLDEAASTCPRALQRTTELGLRRLAAGARMSLGDLHAARGRHARAHSLYQEVLESVRGEIASVEEPVLEKLVTVHEAMGNPAAALESLRELVDFRQRRRENQRQSLIDELEVRYQVEQQEDQIELLRLDAQLQSARLARRNLMLVSAAVALALVTLLALVSWRAYRTKSRMERELSERNRELEEAVRTIGRLAREDELTGLLNRRAFLERAGEELRRRQRTGRPLTIAMGDIDRFKQLNDRFGHAVGDEVLRSVAEKMRRLLRDLDIVCRWGGEEFLVLFPDTSPDQAIAVLDRLRRGFSGKSLNTPAGTFHITLTFGITQVADDVPGAIERADQAMYRGKQQGRDRIVSAAA